MITEHWLQVPGYEGRYEVSDMGRVRSLGYLFRTVAGTVGSRPGRILKQQRQPDGRMSVSLRANYHRREARVHQLVLAAFVGPRPVGQVSRHYNDIADDNRLENLSYGTQSENLLDRRRNGNDPNANKTHCLRGHPFDELNTYVQPSRPTARYCRACVRLRQQKAAA